MELVYCGGMGVLDVRVDWYVACMAVVGLCPGVDVEKREQDPGSLCHGHGIVPLELLSCMRRFPVQYIDPL
jgi:hypothetical protein